MNKGKKVIITVLAILLGACIALNVYILGFLKKDVKDNKPKDENPVVEKNTKTDFPVVKVQNLNEKLSTLDFSNKTSVEVQADDSDETGEYKPKTIDTITIENNEVIVKNDIGSYKIEVSNPISVGAKWSVQNVSVFYILTADGKVYRAMSDSGSEKLFRGPEDLGVSNVMSISVPYDFFLNENAFGGEQVYMKTSYGKVYTDESFPDIDDNVVEVVEQ